MWTRPPGRERKKPRSLILTACTVCGRLHGMRDAAMNLKKWCSMTCYQNRKGTA